MSIRRRDPRSFYQGLFFSALGISVGTIAGVKVDPNYNWMNVAFGVGVWLAFAGLLWFLFMKRTRPNG